MHGKTQKTQCLCGIVREASFIYASVSSQHRYDHFDNPPNTKTVKIDSQHLYYISFWEQSQDVIKIFVKTHKIVYFQ